MFRSTTILSVRQGGRVAIGGDGQVSIGETIVKADARKIRRLYHDKVLVGFAGAAADAFSLMEKFESKLEEHQGNVLRAAHELHEALVGQAIGGAAAMPGAARHGQRQGGTPAALVLRYGVVAEPGCQALLFHVLDHGFGGACERQHPVHHLLDFGLRSHFLDAPTSMFRKRQVLAPCVIIMICIGSPLPQLVSPYGRQSARPATASQDFQKSVVFD